MEAPAGVASLWARRSAGSVRHEGKRVRADWAADHHIANRRPVLGRWIDDDQDIADLASRLDVPVGLNDLIQGVPPINDRLKLTRLEQSLEVLHQPLVVLRRNGKNGFLYPDS